MPRYINADKLRQEWLENGENEHVYDTNAFLDSIDNQPTADVAEVVHGYWNEYSTSTYGGVDKLNKDKWINRKFYRCSECHKGTVIKTPLCPHCGAKMNLEEEKS